METAQIDDLLVRLAGIPARVAAAVAGWGEARWRAPSDEGGWSAAEVFAHMRASDDILAARAPMLLTRDQAPLAAYDERRWVEVAGYAQADFQTSLQAYTLRRAELVRVLRRAEPADWQRVGMHEVRGPLSLLEVVTHLLAHEEEHCAQLEQLPGARS